MGTKHKKSRLVYFFRVIAIEVVCLILSLATIFVVGMACGLIAVSVYDHTHAIPNPVERGDDLGGPLIGFWYAFLSLLISLPISVLIHIYVFRKYLLRKEQNNG